MPSPQGRKVSKWLCSGPRLKERKEHVTQETLWGQQAGVHKDQRSGAPGVSALRCPADLTVQADKYVISGQSMAKLAPGGGWHSGPASSSGGLSGQRQQRTPEKPRTRQNNHGGGWGVKGPPARRGAVGTEGRDHGAGVHRPGCESWLCHQLAVQPGASHCPSLKKTVLGEKRNNL